MCKHVHIYMYKYVCESKSNNNIYIYIDRYTCSLYVYIRYVIYIYIYVSYLHIYITYMVKKKERFKFKKKRVHIICIVQITVFTFNANWVRNLSSHPTLCSHFWQSSLHEGLENSGRGPPTSCREDPWKKMSHHIHGINFMSSLRNSCPSIHDNLAEWWASQACLSQCPQVTLSCIQLNQIKFSGPGGESPTACHTIFKPKCFDTLTLELQKIFTEKPIKWGLQQDSVEVFLRVPAGGCNARVLWLQNDKDVRTKQQSLVENTTEWLCTTHSWSMLKTVRLSTNSTT